MLAAAHYPFPDQTACSIRGFAHRWSARFHHHLASNQKGQGKDTRAERTQRVDRAILVRVHSRLFPILRKPRDRGTASTPEPPRWPSIRAQADLALQPTRPGPEVKLTSMPSPALRAATGAKLGSKPESSLETSLAGAETHSKSPALPILSA